MKHCPKISIIVPVYNAENRLHKCINSILNQNYTDFELLLIDDGSTDTSGRICDKYSKKDSRVSAYHKSNGGVSSARNLGLDNSKGEWITFCDSDDWVAPQYLTNLLSHLDEQIDLVFSYSTIVHGDGSEIKEQYDSKCVDMAEIESVLIDNELYWHTSPWSKLYKYSLIHDHSLRFSENMHIGEDFVFLYTYLMNCKRIFISSDTDYFYNFETSDSLTKKINTFESELSSYKNVQTVIQLLIDKRVISKDETVRRFEILEGIYVRRVLSALYHNKVSYKMRIKAIKELDIDLYTKTAHISALKEKILAFLLDKRCFYLYDFVREMSHLFRCCKKK